MSRIGRTPVQIPAGVTVNVAEGNVVTVSGKLGSLTRTFDAAIAIAVNGNEVNVTRNSEDRRERSLHGLTRTLINNMIVGVSAGYEKKLEIEGVGYRAEKQGNKLVLNLGYSHPIYFVEENGITFDVPNNTTVVVKGINKEVVGQIAADVRAKRPPEPYLGKGVRYSGEKIRRKAGKTGK